MLDESSVAVVRDFIRWNFPGAEISERRPALEDSCHFLVDMGVQNIRRLAVVSTFFDEPDWQEHLDHRLVDLLQQAGTRRVLLDAHGASIEAESYCRSRR